MYPREARDAMTRALRFRHRIVPYLHTMNHRAAVEGVPLVRPMYHLAPRARTPSPTSSPSARSSSSRRSPRPATA
jgi:hypothetical protein